MKAITALQNLIGAPVEIRYNGLTATPRHLFSRSAYLTAPSLASPESIARNFLHRNRELFRFSDADLNNLRLKSRATAATGTTTLLFEQQAAGLPVYHGEVLVNVNRLGQILNVGGESFPQLRIANTEAITPEQAVSAAAAALGASNFTPQSLGAAQELATYGDLPPQYIPAEKFSRGGVFTDDIVVTRTVFPLGSEGRIAYKFILTTPQYNGIMWENVVDAQTGEVLRRASLTAFHGPAESITLLGGGQGIGRLSTFRPDIQNQVEAFNPAATAVGKVFDGLPTTFSGPGGRGRPAGPGQSPTYDAESSTSNFRFSLVEARYQNPLVYDAPFGQVLRGLPDAQNPSAGSRFGWFYLPTGAGGAEITAGNANRAATRAFGYSMHPEARGRNLAANSPNGDGDQPFSAQLTALSAVATLADGRVLSAVFQSSYTEGNNVVVSDDHADDNEATPGIKGFAANRQFNAGYFDYANSYEFGGVDAGGTPFFPPSSFPDVYPATLTLFYFNNLLHDYLHGVGFTEPFWNFQQDNFGVGGAGGDAVSVNAMDGSGTDNANFGTPADGSPPRMQMYLFTDGGFRRSDGDFDFDVVAHEFYHGVSNRSAAKGGTGGLGLALIGESGGQGEGWSDYIAASMTDDDAVGEYATGNMETAIRRRALTNYRWSYGTISGLVGLRRDRGAPDALPGLIPFEVHDIGEIWAATLWDMRELLIMKDPAGIFFDGDRRLGGGTAFYIGNRRVQSGDGKHPIEYRESLDTDDAQAIVRPGRIAAEIAALGHRNGPLATAVSRAARLADMLVLRGLQLSPLNPSFVDSRDAILLADRELTGGENQAVIWRAFASHGVGAGAQSTTSLGGGVAGQSVPIVVEDFTVPASVSQCEAIGPLAAPSYTVKNLVKNQATIVINDGIPVNGAAFYAISRGTSPDGPFTKIAEVPAPDTTWRDTNNGQGLALNQTYYYQVRAARNAECVSTAITRSVKITVGDPISVTPAPIFDGVSQVEDPQQCNRLIVKWSPAFSANPQADIVYDVYRVTSVAAGNGTQEPTFTPSASNRVATNLTGTAYTDTGLTLNQPYYYIVQARDRNNGKKDTGNTGNTLTRWNAPTSPASTAAPVFAPENFEAATANTRFVPPLVDSATPNLALPAFQRVTGVEVSPGVISAVMFAPDFSPTEGQPDPGGTHHGGASDFAAIIGPLTLTANSLMEFDHFFRTEANFDGGVIEIALGAPTFLATPYPNNATTFDLGNYIIFGGYNAKLDGTLEGVAFLSPLQGRRAWTGSMGLHHVRVTLRAFAPGGANNPLGLPVYIRFRMTSDVATSAGPGGGWYIDNLVVRNLAACGL
ncbi:MAG TPA: M36 family metallopeptidase [Blastocatellia bacterium]|nr:M36 family metallopeptidase [Blastocatellia bacterium]